MDIKRSEKLAAKRSTGADAALDTKSGVSAVGGKNKRPIQK